jgi:hypothetical protein
VTVIGPKVAVPVGSVGAMLATIVTLQPAKLRTGSKDANRSAKSSARETDGRDMMISNEPIGTLPRRWGRFCGKQIIKQSCRLRYQPKALLEAMSEGTIERVKAHT